VGKIPQSPARWPDRCDGGFIHLKVSPWLRRLITRSLAIIPTIIVVAVTGEQGTEKLLILSQVILSLQLSFAVVPLVLFTGNKKMMGEFVNARWLKALAWFVAVLIAGLNGWLLVLWRKVEPEPGNDFRWTLGDIRGIHPSLEKSDGWGTQSVVVIQRVRHPPMEELRTKTEYQLADDPLGLPQITAQEIVNRLLAILIASRTVVLPTAFGPTRRFAPAARSMVSSVIARKLRISNFLRCMCFEPQGRHKSYTYPVPNSRTSFVNG